MPKRMKGKAEIELTDVKTGTVEKIVENNMVTNAANDALNNNVLNWHSYRSMANLFLPICPNTIGGVLLYENIRFEAP